MGRLEDRRHVGIDLKTPNCSPAFPGRAHDYDSMLFWLAGLITVLVVALDFDRSAGGGYEFSAVDFRGSGLLGALHCRLVA